MTTPPFGTTTSRAVLTLIASTLILMAALGALHGRRAGRASPAGTADAASTAQAQIRGMDRAGAAPGTDAREEAGDRRQSTSGRDAATAAASDAPAIGSAPVGSAAEGGRTILPHQIPPPVELAGFYDLPANYQLAAIAGLEADPHLSAAVVAFLSDALLDRRLTASTRNNIANCLLGQPRVDPRLHLAFIAMIHDPAESETWREYAVQQLAQCRRTSVDPQRITDELLALADHGEHGIPGTALLCLHRLMREGAATIDQEAFSSRLAAILGGADRPAGRPDPLTIATALSIAAERRERTALPLIRRYACDPLPSIRRIAVASLGTIGSTSDLPLLASACADPDPGVTMAARSALGRLRQQHGLPMP